jgi:hypothetical protein
VRSGRARCRQLSAPSLRRPCARRPAHSGLAGIGPGGPFRADGHMPGQPGWAAADDLALVGTAAAVRTFARTHARTAAPAPAAPVSPRTPPLPPGPAGASSQACQDPIPELRAPPPADRSAGHGPGWAGLGPAGLEPVTRPARASGPVRPHAHALARGRLRARAASHARAPAQQTRASAQRSPACVSPVARADCIWPVSGLPGQSGASVGCIWPVRVRARVGASVRCDPVFDLYDQYLTSI